MKSYAPEAVAMRLKSHLKIALLGNRFLRRTPPSTRTPPGRRGEEVMAPIGLETISTATPQELARVVDALTHIPADDRRIWREVTVALCDWFMGDARGRALVDAWAGGGTFEGIAFSGCPEKFDPAAQDLLWRQAIGRAEFSVATVFHHAKKLGRWNASRARWGLGRSQRDHQTLPVAARGVQAAGLKMPRQHMNLERLAWLYQVLLAIKRPDSREVAFVISGFINGASGIAFPKFETIAKALHWEPGDRGVGYRRVSHAVRGLALDGFLARSPGNARGAHGRIGPSFALTLPGAMTWQEAINAYRAVFGVKADTSDLASTDIRQCGSEPESMASTSTGRCQSMPNAAGRDQHQTMPVQTASSCDQHQPMPVHLSTNSQEEGAEAKPGSALPRRLRDSRQSFGNRPGTRHRARRSTGEAAAAPEPGPCPVQHHELNQMRRRAYRPGRRSFGKLPTSTRTWPRPTDACPPTSSSKLREAAAKGMDDHLAEVARKLSGLRGLGLDDDQIRDQVIAARETTYSRPGRRSALRAGSQRTRPTASGPPQCRRAHSLAVWRLRSPRGSNGLSATRLPVSLTPDHDRTDRSPDLPASRTGSSQRLLANPIWSVGRTIATNADLLGLCEEFPDDATQSGAPALDRRLRQFGCFCRAMWSP